MNRFVSRLQWSVIPGDLRKCHLYGGSAVYMLVSKMNGYKKILIHYIGSSKHLSLRLHNHQIRRYLNNNQPAGQSLLVYFHKCEEPNRLKIEASLINIHRPKLNKSHNQSNGVSYDEKKHPLNGRFSSWVIKKLAEHGIKIDQSDFSTKKKLNTFTDRERAALSVILKVEYPK